ncbi:MAG: dTDP-4-dehydrorhamnose 3,5-epimerase [Syntrophobacteraceae bacterium]
MKLTTTKLEGVVILEPRVFADERGFFWESYNAKTLSSLGIDVVFVQDNHSMSRKGTLRGIHYQVRTPQAKLVRVINGEVFDVAVDLRKSSPTFGQWFGLVLSAANKLQLFIPPGFGHGFLALSQTVEVLYKAGDFYSPENERCILWNDPNLAIDWPSRNELVISAKDAAGTLLREADLS